MRTTDPDGDVEAAIAELQRERGIERSRALDELARRCAARRDRPGRCQLTPRPLGARIDVSNIGEVLDPLDGD